MACRPYWKENSNDFDVKLYVIQILCNVGNILLIIAFGLCDSVYPALVIRFIHGLLDGVIPVCKTIQTEIATPETIGFISSLFFVGASIGGYV